MSLGRRHGVLVTFRRPEDLRRSLDALAEQTQALDTLVVIDNDADSRVERLVTSHRGAAPDVSYVPMPDNLGPAGAIHAGVAAVLAHAADDDWIVLFDDDDPPERRDCLEQLGVLLVELRSTEPSCAGVGLWGATLSSWSGRVRAEPSRVPAPVTYVPGGSMPHYLVGAVRAVGAPEPDLFFGFDDLDFGLRLRDGGFSLFSSGLAREHGVGHMVDGRRASARSAPPTWRRYYSLRNLIVVLRDHGELRGALVMSVVAGVVKPVLNLVRNPRVAAANLSMNARALLDGWRGRLGRTISPSA